MQRPDLIRQQVVTSGRLRAAGWHGSGMTAFVGGHLQRCHQHNRTATLVGPAGCISWISRAAALRRFLTDPSLSLIHLAAYTRATMSREPSLRIPAFYSQAVTFLTRVLLAALNFSFPTSGGSGTLRPEFKLNCSQTILNKKVERWLASAAPPPPTARAALDVEGQVSPVCKQAIIRCNGTSVKFIIFSFLKAYFKKAQYKRLLFTIIISHIKMSRWE